MMKNCIGAHEIYLENKDGKRIGRVTRKIYLRDEKRVVRFNNEILEVIPEYTENTLVLSMQQIVAYGRY